MLLRSPVVCVNKMPSMDVAIVGSVLVQAETPTYTDNAERAPLMTNAYSEWRTDQKECTI